MPEWIDINNHMNVAYYVLAFDQGVDSLWDRFGLTDEHVREQPQFNVRGRIAHHLAARNVAVADPYIVTSQILAFDEKRIHQFMRMYHADEGYLVATAEWMNLHVDLDVRRVAPWPDDILRQYRELFCRSRANTHGPRRRAGECTSRYRFLRTEASDAT